MISFVSLVLWIDVVLWSILLATKSANTAPTSKNITMLIFVVIHIIALAMVP